MKYDKITHGIKQKGEVIHKFKMFLKGDVSPLEVGWKLAEAFIGEMRALDRFAKEKKVVGRERQEPIRNPTAQGKNSSKNTCTLIWSGF